MSGAKSGHDHGCIFCYAEAERVEPDIAWTRLRTFYAAARFTLPLRAICSPDLHLPQTQKWIHINALAF
jgi:hypothetical protein